MNDTVSWTATTSGRANQEHSVGIFFPDDTPFVDSNNRPVYALVWSDRDEASPSVAAVDSDAPLAACYKYVVAVFDSLKSKTYIDDPKVIIGTGGLMPRQEVKELEQKVEKVAKSVADVEKQLKAIETKLNQPTKKPK